MEAPAAADAGFDVLEALGGFHAGVAIGKTRGSITLTVERATTFEALAEMPAILEVLRPIVGTIAVTAIEVVAREEFEAALRRPAIPDLVGITEIAEMTGVSRQRANALVKQPGFPPAVVSLTAGQFRRRADVKRWLEQWDRRPGRRQRSSMPHT
ncbi:helix-turn-helix transcriptional regulator [Arthrobacter sp. A2-55]|uniref:helix-turn-helix transcriptional regulator n=1 Tax=Arthrobacter sp. A2-55 TaxID=2897337 RepID=UPI0021CDA99C|nr:helix-turn-helix domain-containing protein [Arthrobacter sp. A2-55]MCU6481961.1 helix-turn-helix domain-containing protein [Arthrobacter sp. A2-55]